MFNIQTSIRLDGLFTSGFFHACVFLDFSFFFPFRDPLALGAVNSVRAVRTNPFLLK